MIPEEDARFLAYDAQGNTKIVNDIREHSEKFCGFINIINQRKEDDDEEMFMDSTFCNASNTLQSIEFQRRVIMKRLSRLYPKKYRPSLFPAPQSSIFIKIQQMKVPHFIYQMQLFNVSFFKKLFITQQIADNGKYWIVVNKDGRFQVQVVDDFVPVYEQDQESIWGLNTEQPWQLIISKVWAKHLGGYQNIQKAKPFEFLSYFSQPNWKYYNLSLDGQNFLSFYANKKDQHSKILLKTKNANEVQELGLIPNILGYQLLEIEYEPKTNKKALIIIKSILPHSWTGKLSIFDKQFETVFQSSKKMHNFSLSNTLVLTQNNFFNLFSSAYITTQNLYPDYGNYHQFRLQANCKEASFFEFQIKRQGYFIFSINQPQQNKILLTNKKSRSKLTGDNNDQEENIKERYLQLKYMLSRQIISGDNISQRQEGKDSLMASHIKESKKRFQQKYHQLKYDSIQMQYKKGYNRGDAHFLKIIPGRYVLRIRTQSFAKPSIFTIYISTHEYCSISPLNFTKQQSRTFLNHSLISISDTVPYKNITSKDYERLSFGNLFKAIGYGFIAFKVTKQSPYSYVLEIDPSKLKQEGYSLKNEHKNKTKPFSLQSQGGQSIILILKRLNDGRPEDQYIWPTNCVRVTSKKT